jgi:teichuronic acid biosynthesis glycosyltransferase TuaG
MSEPLVSVCIGTYNRERYIRECLDSVFAQTYPKLEVIVVDNASTDRTIELVQSYGDRVRLIRREVNSGMCSTTRNQAVKGAQGQYIAFLDSDDSWYPGKIEKQVQFMQANPDIPLCHTYCRLMDAGSVEERIRHEGKIPPTGNYFEALLDHCWITISTVLMKRSLYGECGPFTETLPYGRLGEDYEFFLKVARKHEIGFIPEVLARYRKAGDGISGGDWRGFPEAFPFIRCLWSRKDIFGDVVSRSRLDDMLCHSALESSRYWRDHGYGLRAAYFPAQLLMKLPFCGGAWLELGKSLFRAGFPNRIPGNESLKSRE